MDLMNELKLVDSDARWMDKASCLGLDANLFFPLQGRADCVKEAKKVCAACPARNKCLEWANINQIAYGVWGGLTVSERKKSGKLKSR